MTTVADIIDTIERQNEQAIAWRKKNDEEREEMKAALESLQKKGNRPQIGHITNAGEKVDQKALADAVRALLAGDQTKAMQLFGEAKAMSAGSDPDGGYITASTFSNEMTKIMAEISPLYRLARVVDTTDVAFEEPVDKDDTEAQWVGETTERTDTETPQLGMFRCDLHEISAMPKASQKLIDTARVDIVQWLQGKVADAFGVKESNAFHLGDGVAKPRGILTYTNVTTADATRAWGQLQYIATGASGAFPTPSTSVNPADVLIDTVGALKAQYRNGATWLMNRTTAALCRKLKDADGRHVWVDSLSLGESSVLLGYPVEISEDMPDVSAGSLSIAFGNFRKGYTIAQRPGVKFLVDPYTNKPNVRLYAYRRIGGGINNFESIKLVKFS